MPIYEYRCTKCGDFEQMRKISEPPLQRCPTCRRKVTKLMSSTSFQLKGSGWYATDYAKKGTDKSTDKGADKSAEKSAEAKAGDKPETSDKKTEKKESTAKKDSSSPKASAAA